MGIWDTIFNGGKNIIKSAVGGGGGNGFINQIS